MYHQKINIFIMSILLPIMCVSSSSDYGLPCDNRGLQSIVDTSERYQTYLQKIEDTKDLISFLSLPSYYSSKAREYEEALSGLQQQESQIMQQREELAKKRAKALNLLKQLTQ